METADKHKGCSAAEQVQTTPHTPSSPAAGGQGPGPQEQQGAVCSTPAAGPLLGARGHALPGAPGNSLQNSHVPALMASGSPLVL